MTTPFHFKDFHILKGPVQSVNHRKRDGYCVTKAVKLGIY